MSAQYKDLQNVFHYQMKTTREEEKSACQTAVFMEPGNTHEIFYWPIWFIEQ